jgi:diguanylate cyclase (GGDEF)-like protein
VTSKIIEEAKIVNKIIGFMFLDLDGFKAVNDTFGHDSGDLVLQETARRISNIIRNNDICIRLGGDEFLVLLTEIKDKMHSCLVARRLISAISQPINLDIGSNIIIGVSIGIASYPSDGVSVEELMNKSDEAMYKAKKIGKNNYQLYLIEDQ